MHPLITERLRIGGITSWEIADLLGVHPHQLERDEFDRHRSNDEDRLRALPVSALIQLCQRLDLHPGDLLQELDELCSSRRRPPREDAEEAPGEVTEDARVMAATLLHIGAPLALDKAAQALEWSFARARAAIEHLQAHTDLTGPYALRRVGADIYTLTSRTDLLTANQRAGLDGVIVAAGELPLEYVGVLEALLAGAEPDHAAAAVALPVLRELGLVVGSAEEGDSLAPEVLYSLTPGESEGGSVSGDSELSSSVTDRCRFQ